MQLRPDLAAMRRYLKCARLNLRMLGHILADRWLDKSDVSAGYDRLAADYDANWLVNLKPVSDRLVAALPADGVNTAIDLGCGTGYITAALEKRYPQAAVIGVDISPGMLAEARKICLRAELACADMLEFLRQRPECSADLIVSGWAIGYSIPEKVIAECGRVLRPGGTLALVVNYADTLAPVFYAFRRSMAAFPEKVGKALWPRFPQDRTAVEKMFLSGGFGTALVEEGRIEVKPPNDETAKLPWLLKTGIIAGFDAVLPLRDDREVAAYFEDELQRCDAPIEHHYLTIKGICRK